VGKAPEVVSRDDESFGVPMRSLQKRHLSAESIRDTRAAARFGEVAIVPSEGIHRSA